MSLMTQVSPFLVKLQNWKITIPYHSVNLSTSQKVIAVSVSASVVLLGVLARYLRRRRAPRPQRKTRKGRRQFSIRSPNGDVLSQASSRRSYSPLRRHGSIQALSDGLSLASGSLGGAGHQVTTGAADCAHLTPQQLGVMGMEALETSITYWEDALSSFPEHLGSLAVMSPEEAEFCREIQNLLDAAYGLQDQSELLFLDQRSVLFRAESVDSKPASKTTTLKNLDKMSDTGIVTSRSNMSSADSFASAQDRVADLREFEEFTEMFPDIDKLLLYQTALKQFENSGIPYRTLRTEMVHCGSDIEYLAKLHCIRLTFQLIFKDRNTGSWFADTGRQILTDLLLYGDKDPKDFLVGYEGMLCFLQDPNNWPKIEQELSYKNVKAMTFYDIVMDYILMDAFEDLDSPPSSVTAVVQNRWLSNGFKETALTTAVWSVLKAKRRMSKYPDGFMSRFYTITEQISPLMAWGFLGPDENLSEMCHYFKDQLMCFFIDIFNFQKCQYTTVEQLSKDVLNLLKTRVDNISVKLSQ